jgi:hypothetical protein
MKNLIIFVLSCIGLVSMGFAQNVNCQEIVTLNTGYNHTSNSLYAVGAWDNYWSVVSGPTTGACGPYVYPNPAAVINTAVGWDGLGAGSYTGAKWLSFRPTSDLNCNNTCAAGLAPVVFERKFCTRFADTIIINAKLRFDNSACLFIDSHAIPLSTVLASSGAPTTYGTLGSTTGCNTCELWNDTKTFNGNYDARTNSFKVFLTPGTHKVQIRVRNNSSVSFGAVMEGIISSQTIASNFECPANCSPNNTIAIKKVLDRNCDGKLDAGDSMGAGWSFNVTGPGGFNTTVTTDVTGYAFVTGLAVGSYTVTEVAQAGWATNTPTQTATVTATQTPVLTFFNCEKQKPCIEVVDLKATCDKIVNGVQTYLITGGASNGNNSNANFSIVSNAGGSTSGLTPTTIPNTSSVLFSFIYTPGSTNNPCFTASLSSNGQKLCSKEFCVTLPVCQCLEVSYKLECNKKISPNTPQSHLYQVVINNPTAGTINIPMTNTTGILSPSSINAAPGTNTYTVYYQPNAGTTQACILFGTGIVPLPIPICKPPTSCIPLPDCRCTDAAVLVSDCQIVNGVQVVTVKGAVTSNIATNAVLSVTALQPGSATFISPTVTTVNANAVNHPFTISYTPSSTAPSFCFVITLSTPTIVCRDTICVKNNCPQVPPPTSNKCCPTTKMKPCCINDFEIKYEFTAAAVPVCIKGMIVTTTPSAGVIGGSVYSTPPLSTVAGPLLLNGYTTFSPTVAAGKTLTYFITIPTTNPQSTVKVRYVTCAGDTCGVETFKIGKSNVISDATVVSSVPKDVLYATSFRLDLSKLNNNAKIKSISLVTNDTTDIKSIFYAISGGEMFGSENKTQIALSSSLQGQNAASFFFKDAIGKENYKGEVINVVLTRKVSLFKIMLFDEEGALVSTSSISPILASKGVQKNPSSLSIAPNPASDDVSLSFFLPTAQKVAIDLYDINGKLVKSIGSNFYEANETQKVQLNVSDLDNGLYFIRLTNSDGQYFTEKLTIVR